VGATAVGIYDIRVTPFSSIFPGVEVHANVIDNFLRNDFLNVSTSLWGWNLAALVIMGLIMGWSIPRLHAWASFILFLELAIAYVAIVYYLFSRWDHYYQMVYPLQTLLSVYVGVGLMRLLNVERERKRIKSTFQSFVAPEVVNEMLRHPEKLRLGGEKRDLTVIFSDIRGFTTLAETMDPEDLVNLLHTYLTPMTDIVFRHGGTVDKYIGDAVMAIYGAPLDLPQHADHACLTSLDMVASLRELCQEWTARGWPSIQIGIGINSGPMTVGNLGSERLFDYTVIGDHVNLAARLEGLNKYYGTTILISEYTARLLQNPFIMREVDKVRVKGKQTGVVVYEVMGLGEPDDEQAWLLQTFAAGLKAFRDQQFVEAARLFGACLEIFPTDGPSRLLRERCQEFLSCPPPPDWDGCTAMTKK
ncbi:MAG: adenylate/guanylate cyclase domain-containing protein, partial [Methanosarcinales archaeon]|nr:adenylate/guanylate cyclase domain-containing protein [Methanosarcinales archaeon]